MRTRFYVIKKGERFKFECDASNAVCIKIGPTTYRVESASNPICVGLVCSLDAGIEVFKMEN